jgi:hypothetical protein
MKLKNWSMYCVPLSDFSAPELNKYYLQGNVYDNPKFTDGLFVSTSRIMDIIDMRDYKVGVTKNGSEYELHKEDVDPKCEKQYPNYYDKLKCK